MMIPIKIQCGCGQRYAFDVESGVYLLPGNIACPVCGADGTATVNAIIARSLSPQPTVAAATVAGSRTRGAMPLPAQPVVSASPPPAVRPPGAKPHPGQVDHIQAQHEARAKIFWGDPPEEVIKFLMIKGIGHEEAAGMVSALFQERAATIRGNGIRKILTGIPLIAVPVVAYRIFAGIGIIPMRIFGLTIMVGLWGAWMLLKGTIMSLTPKSESGDLADQ